MSLNTQVKLDRYTYRYIMQLNIFLSLVSTKFFFNIVSLLISLFTFLVYDVNLIFNLLTNCHTTRTASHFLMTTMSNHLPLILSWHSAGYLTVTTTPITSHFLRTMMPNLLVNKLWFFRHQHYSLLAKIVNRNISRDQKLKKRDLKWKLHILSRLEI